MGTSVNNLKHVNVNFSLDKLYEDIRHYLVISHPHLVYFHVFNTVNGMKMLNQITKCLDSNHGPLVLKQPLCPLCRSHIHFEASLPTYIGDFNHAIRYQPVHSRL